MVLIRFYYLVSNFLMIFKKVLFEDFDSMLLSSLDSLTPGLRYNRDLLAISQIKAIFSKLDHKKTFTNF